jgi:hypothetical protein
MACGFELASSKFKTTKKMKWNIQTHKVGTGQQEIQVKLLVKELQDTWATDAQTKEHLKIRFKLIPKRIVLLPNMDTRLPKIIQV